MKREIESEVDASMSTSHKKARLEKVEEGPTVQPVLLFPQTEEQPPIAPPPVTKKTVHEFLKEAISRPTCVPQPRLKVFSAATSPTWVPPTGRRLEETRLAREKVDKFMKMTLDDFLKGRDDYESNDAPPEPSEDHHEAFEERVEPSVQQEPFVAESHPETAAVGLQIAQPTVDHDPDAKTCRNHGRKRRHDEPAIFPASDDLTRDDLEFTVSVCPKRQRTEVIERAGVDRTLGGNESGLDASFCVQISNPNKGLQQRFPRLLTPSQPILRSIIFKKEVRIQRGYLEAQVRKTRWRSVIEERTVDGKARRVSVEEMGLAIKKVPDRKLGRTQGHETSRCKLGGERSRTALKVD